MKVTIKEIANAAGVSIATVSKVVNGKDHNITPATRQRVLETINELNYVPNRIASSMITKNTYTIGLVIPDITNPFFPEVARGVEDYANQAGYHVVLCNSDNNLKKESTYIYMLQEKMVDGIIITSSTSSVREESARNYMKIGIPIITVDRDMKDFKTQGKILVDNTKGAFEAVSYMIEKGYKKILHLSGSMNSTPSIQRFEGYKNALKYHNIDFDPDLYLEGTYDVEWGYEGIKKIMDKKIDFDSVFCGNDLIAIGAMKAIKELRFRIPEDIGIMGFDNIYIAGVVTPSLSTVNQPNYKMGYKAAELLINFIKNPSKPEDEVVLETELIIRESTL